MCSTLIGGCYATLRPSARSTCYDLLRKCYALRGKQLAKSAIRLFSRTLPHSRACTHALHSRIFRWSARARRCFRSRIENISRDTTGQASFQPRTSRAGKNKTRFHQRTCPVSPENLIGCRDETRALLEMAEMRRHGFTREPDNVFHGFTRGTLLVTRGALSEWP